jgi:hypothetical protein
MRRTIEFLGFFFVWLERAGVLKGSNYDFRAGKAHGNAT